MIVTVVIAVIAIYGYFEIKKQLQDITQETTHKNPSMIFISNEEENIKK